MSEELQDPRRRWALGELARRGVGAAGAALGLGKQGAEAQTPLVQRPERIVLPPSASPSERQRWIHSQYQQFRAWILGNRETFSTGSEADALRAAFIDQPARTPSGEFTPMTEAHLKNTVFDVEEIKNRHPYMVVAHRDSQGVTHLTLIPPGEQYLAPRMVFGTVRGYASGFFIRDPANNNELRFVTNAHVLGRVLQPSNPTAWKNQFRDIAVMKVPPEMIKQVPAENIVPYDPMLRDENIAGLMGVCVGADPDETSDVSGNKAYISGVVPTVWTALRRALEKPEGFPARYFNQFLRRSIIMRLPAGEAAEHFDQLMGTISRRAAGNSGKPILVWRNNQWVLGGVFWGVNEIHTDGKDVDVGLGIGISGVVSGLADPSNQYTLPAGVRFSIHS